MSSSGSFSGLQFRILEVLEKQPRQAPLTALEIADILHSGEYRNEMKDNVVFKVSRAVHGMKEQGKIVVSDARDREGRLCYQLPQRLRFPPKISDNPANPVLTPETAAKIKTTEPEPEPIRKGKQRPLYVPGINNKIVEHLNKAPHPMTTADFARELGHLYGSQVSPQKLTTLFSGNLHHLVKIKRTVFRRRVKDLGRGIMYEYYTRRTGTEPHPLSKKEASKPPVVEAEQPVAAAPRSSAWQVPTNQELANDLREIHQQETGEEIPPTRSALFRPHKPVDYDIVLSLSVPPAWNGRLVDAARISGISVTEFIMQAVDFAIDHLDA